MSKTKRPLAEALEIAAVVEADLKPHCLRFQIAGSVRRRKPFVSDIEAVAIPATQGAGLFGDIPESALYSYLHVHPERYRFIKGDHADGRYHQLWLPEWEMQLDLFLASADNWGITLVVRTGDALFCQALLTRWKYLHHIPADQPGSVGGRLVTAAGLEVPTPEEEDVFRLLQIRPVLPEERRDAYAVYRAADPAIGPHSTMTAYQTPERRI